MQTEAIAIQFLRMIPRTAPIAVLAVSQGQVLSISQLRRIVVAQWIQRYELILGSISAVVQLVLLMKEPKATDGHESCHVCTADHDHVTFAWLLF